MSIPLTLSEADLHGLVDGRLEAGRRADALRALAASATDRAKVEAWQEQNDLIRSAFSGIEKESLPVSLRLVAPPTLHCVPSPAASLQPPPIARPARGRQVLATLATAIVVAIGLGGSWMLLQQADDSSQVVDLQLRGPVDTSLATLTVDAVATDANRRAKPGAPAQAAAAGPMPTTSIPDLTPAGLVFTSAESRSTEPSSLVFHYVGNAGEHVVVSIARASRAGTDAAPIRIGRTFSWHHGANAYAVAGTVRPDRLRAIATLIQGSSVEE